MTIKELIDLLKHLPEDATVWEGKPVDEQEEIIPSYLYVDLCFTPIRLVIPNEQHNVNAYIPLTSYLSRVKEADE